MQKQDLKRIINLFVLSLLFTIGTTAQTKLRADNIDQVVYWCRGHGAVEEQWCTAHNAVKPQVKLNLLKR